MHADSTGGGFDVCGQPAVGYTCVSHSQPCCLLSRVLQYNDVDVVICVSVLLAVSPWCLVLSILFSINQPVRTKTTLRSKKVATRWSCCRFSFINRARFGHVLQETRATSAVRHLPRMRRAVLRTANNIVSGMQDMDG